MHFEHNPLFKASFGHNKHSFNSHLQLINIFDESKLIDTYYMFFNVSSNIVVCMKKINKQSQIYSELKLNNAKKCYAIDCYDDSESKQKAHVFDTY